jgi:hypothetical protein
MAQRMRPPRSSERVDLTRKREANEPYGYQESVQRTMGVAIILAPPSHEKSHE